jgi:A/G-specific adenine glycosylase
MLPEGEASAFRSAVLDFYSREGRDFSWRRTRDPWAILVSEVMLQQTQTHRVEPKYDAWMARFPDAKSVSSASLADIYESWRGLGYNSRAIRLRETSRLCAELYGGVPPPEEKLLLAMPGIGRYTARAVMAFAWGLPGAFLETNIRAALIFHFFKDVEKVRDRELEAVAGELVDTDDPRTWYYALMDYGAWLKKREPDPARKAAVYKRQSNFEGSVRQARGAVLRVLGERASVGLGWMAAESGIDYSRLRAAAEGLQRDGLIELADDVARFAR